MLQFLGEMPNVVVMQTLSKAWGSAGVRLGMAFAQPAIISLMNNVKYPYNVNMLTQQYVAERLANREVVEQQVRTLLDERKWLIDSLASQPCVVHIYPTDANFVLVRVTDADALYKYLLEQGTVVRNRNRVEKCQGCLRITVGTHDENVTLMKQITEYGK